MYANDATRQALSGTNGGTVATTKAQAQAQAQAQDDEDEEEEEDDDDDDDDEEDAAQILQPATKRVKQGAGTTSTSSSGVLDIYTDGSSLGNGQNGASAGIGVFFGVNDKRYGDSFSLSLSLFFLLFFALASFISFSIGQKC